MDNETIAAISTPLGQGAIGLIRISGKDAINVLGKVFRLKNPVDFSTVPSHTVHYGHIVDINNGNVPIDEVLVTIMRAPRTYTREDTVEISCHGGFLILQKILDNVIKAGARLAQPGEFTRRAFLNGRLDLTQAEAVIELINAKTEEASRLAIRHLNGDLSRYIKSIQDGVGEILMLLEVNIDFPEDDVPEINYLEIKDRLSRLTCSLAKIIETYEHGRIIKNGIKTAIIGKANVGKSSLFNILIDNPSRALVTPIPGTTRDFIEESVNIKGRLFSLIDTAGLKKPRGIIEEEVLNLTNRCIVDTSCIIFLLDGSKPLSKKDLEIWEMISDKPKVVVINKIDLLQRISIEKIKGMFHVENIMSISCKENIGIDKLENALLGIADKIYNYQSDLDIIVMNIRHKNILENVKKSLEDAIYAIDTKLSPEFVATDLKHAIENFQELTGERITERVLDDIFSRFCIGK